MDKEKEDRSAPWELCLLCDQGNDMLFANWGYCNDECREADN